MITNIIDGYRNEGHDTKLYLEQFGLRRNASFWTGKQLVPELHGASLDKAFDSATTFSENMDISDWFLDYMMPAEALLCYAESEIKSRDTMAGADLPIDMKIKLNEGGN